MRHFHKIFRFNVHELNEQLEAHPELWGQFSLRKQGVHAEMTDIWVRYNDIGPYLDRGDFHGFNDAHIPVFYPAWYALRALHPIIFRIMALVQGEMLGGILITKIPPGGVIKPHSDKSWHVDYFRKFYTSLQSEAGSFFICHDEPYEEINPKVGETYEFDNHKVHSVENRSAADRITLITCIRTEMFGALRDPTWTPYRGDHAVR